jgi:hypothetical protein
MTSQFRGQYVFIVAAFTGKLITLRLTEQWKSTDTSRSGRRTAVTQLLGGGSSSAQNFTVLLLPHENLLRKICVFNNACDLGL